MIIIPVLMAIVSFLQDQFHFLTLQFLLELTTRTLLITILKPKTLQNQSAFVKTTSRVIFGRIDIKHRFDFFS